MNISKFLLCYLIVCWSFCSIAMDAPLIRSLDLEIDFGNDAESLYSVQENLSQKKLYEIHAHTLFLYDKAHFHASEMTDEENRKYKTLVEHVERVIRQLLNSPNEARTAFSIYRLWFLNRGLIEENFKGTKHSNLALKNKFDAICKNQVQEVDTLLDVFIKRRAQELIIISSGEYVFSNFKKYLNRFDVCYLKCKYIDLALRNQLITLIKTLKK